MATTGIAAMKQLNVADEPEQEDVTVELPLMSADIGSEPLRGLLRHPFCGQLGFDIRPISLVQGALIGQVTDAIIRGQAAECLLEASTVCAILKVINPLGSARIPNSDVLVA